jgi:hypothetical protein
MMGTCWGQRKKRKEIEAGWVHAEPSHWLHEISISETVRHHFWPGRVAALCFYNHLTISQSNLKEPTTGSFGWRELMQLGPSHNSFALVQLVFEARWLDICESSGCLRIWAVGRQSQEIVGTHSNNNESVLEFFA